MPGTDAVHAAQPVSVPARQSRGSFMRAHALTPSPSCAATIGAAAMPSAHAENVLATASAATSSTHTTAIDGVLLISCRFAGKRTGRNTQNRVAGAAMAHAELTISRPASLAMRSFLRAYMFGRHGARARRGEDARKGSTDPCVRVCEQEQRT